MDQVQSDGPTTDNGPSVHENGEPTCSQCGQQQGLENIVHSMTRLCTTMQQRAVEHTSTINTLRQQLIVQERRCNAVITHLEDLNRVEKGLARDAEEAERKAEIEIGVLTSELERLQSLLTAHHIVFDSTT